MASADPAAPSANPAGPAAWQQEELGAGAFIEGLSWR